MKTLDTRKAPGATGAEDPNPLKKEGSRTTNVAHETEGQKTWHEVDRSAVPTPAEVDWAEHHLGPLPIFVTFTDHDAEQVAINGITYRRGGHIIASPSTRDRFRIHLCADAIGKDLEYLRCIIEEARRGRFLRAGWCERKLTSGESVYVYDLARRIDGERWSQRIVACGEVRCRETWHYLDDERHVADVDHLAGYYTVEVQRWDDEADWELSLEVEDGAMPAGVAAQLANALQWHQQAVERLNGSVAGAHA